MATVGQSEARGFWKQSKVLALVCLLAVLVVLQVVVSHLQERADAQAEEKWKGESAEKGGCVLQTVPSGAEVRRADTSGDASIVGTTPLLIGSEGGRFTLHRLGFSGSVTIGSNQTKPQTVVLNETIPLVSSLCFRWPWASLTVLPLAALVALRRRSQDQVRDVAEALPEVFYAGEGGRIGGYRLEKLLGHGAMAEVFSGRSVDGKGPEVAVKVLSEAVSANDEFRGRYQREAAITKQLRHPGIVAVEASGEEGGRLFLVMEKVDGGSLRDRIKPGGVPVAEAVGWTAAVLDALAYAHDQGIVHRDLKPENIMLTAAGAVKVADFGLARGAAYPTLTAVDTTLGTPAYMPPEQVTGSRSTGQADQYAMGCVLYELLTGVPPFTDEDPLMLVFQHMNDDPSSPRELRADLSPALEAAVMKMLAKDPDERFSSASEAAATLREAFQA